MSKVRQAISSFCSHTERYVAPIAVLIDGENMSSDLAVHVLVEAGKYGGVVIRRVYGNWSAPAMSSWQTVAAHYGFTTIHCAQPVPRKNAADITLAVNAIDIYYQGIKHFCLVSSDSDFTSLVLRLREAGCFILGIGKPETLPTLRTACTMFISTEQLTPSLKPPKQHSSPKTEKVLESSTTEFHHESTPPPATEIGFISPSTSDRELIELLKKAYRQASSKGEHEWIPINQLGSSLQHIHPGFTPKTYGASRLKVLIEKYPALFQTQPLKAGQISLRLKQQS